MKGGGGGGERVQPVGGQEVAVGTLPAIVSGPRQERHAQGLGRAAAAWLRTVGESGGRASVPDLVWSGPPVLGLHARDTRCVYEELVGAAERSIWISACVYFDGPHAFASLAQRMDAAPALRVTLLLNLQRSRGDTAVADRLVRRFVDDFWRTDWPGSSRPAVYYDSRSLETDRPASVLHAKAVVFDEEAVFITSANLTEAGFDRNIELGAVIRLWQSA